MSPEELKNTQSCYHDTVVSICNGNVVKETGAFQKGIFLYFDNSKSPARITFKKKEALEDVLKYEWISGGQVFCTENFETCTVTYHQDRLSISMNEEYISKSLRFV